jgi:hypothetical protein
VVLSDGLKSKTAAAFCFSKYAQLRFFPELIMHLFGSGSSGLGYLATPRKIQDSERPMPMYTIGLKGWLWNCPFYQVFAHKSDGYWGEVK